MKLIELHILQSFPVSCLNRDDVGAPKTATFGGVTRARISSQCLKRAIRDLAKDKAPLGQRTLHGGQPLETVRPFAREKKKGHPAPARPAFAGKSRAVNSAKKKREVRNQNEPPPGTAAFLRACFKSLNLS